MQRAHGFTLIELLVTLAIAGLLATIVAPSMSTFMARARLASDVNLVVSALNMARSEAIKRHQNVTITLYLPKDNIERRPACRNGEVLVSDDSEPIYNYPTGCYRITISDEDDDEGELLRKGETKYLKKCQIDGGDPLGHCSIKYESLGQLECNPDSDTCSATGESYQLSFVPPEEHKDVIEKKTRYITTGGSIQKEEESP